LGNDTKKLM